MIALLKIFVQTDEHYIIHLPFIEKEYHYDILLGFGDNASV